MGRAAREDSAGYVAHTLGYPVPSSMYGGGWIYGLSNNRVSIRFSSSRSKRATRASIRRYIFKKWKTNPFVQISSRRQTRPLRRKNLPYGGWYAMLAITLTGPYHGDSGSFLDSQKLKGISPRDKK